MRLVAVARVKGPRGVRGQMWVEPYREGLGERPAGDLVWTGASAEGARTWALREFFTYAKGSVLALDGVTSPEEAEALHGLEVFLPEEAVAPDDPEAFFTDEVLGLPVTDARRGRIGTVVGMDEGKAYWMIRARGDAGEFEIPAVKGLGVVVDREAGAVRVDLPDGYPGLEEGSDAD
ncbi:MAG: ribosome maturation factor RimM [Acidobacteriota bacterium]